MHPLSRKNSKVDPYGRRRAAWVQGSKDHGPWTMSLLRGLAGWNLRSKDPWSGFWLNIAFYYKKSYYGFQAILQTTQKIKPSFQNRDFTCFVFLKISIRKYSYAMVCMSIRALRTTTKQKSVIRAVTDEHRTASRTSNFDWYSSLELRDVRESPDLYDYHDDGMFAFISLLRKHLW